MQVITQNTTLNTTQIIKLLFAYKCNCKNVAHYKPLRLKFFYRDFFHHPADYTALTYLAVNCIKTIYYIYTVSFSKQYTALFLPYILQRKSLFALTHFLINIITIHFALHSVIDNIFAYI